MTSPPLASPFSHPGVTAIIGSLVGFVVGMGVGSAVRPPNTEGVVMPVLHALRDALDRWLPPRPRHGTGAVLLFPIGATPHYATTCWCRTAPCPTPGCDGTRHSQPGANGGTWFYCPTCGPAEGRRALAEYDQAAR